MEQYDTSLRKEEKKMNFEWCYDKSEVQNMSLWLGI